jgi:RNA-binding protein YlmH
MKNFEKYYDFIKDEESRNQVKRICDKASYVSRNFVPAATEFINPYVAKVCIPVLKSCDIKFELFPSYENSERKVFILSPDYCGDIDADEFLCGLRIINRSKFKELDHRDYLGSLMSLGIDRNRTGDIYVFEGFADIVMHRDLAEYVLYSLDKIGHNKIESEIIQLSEVSFKEQGHEIINISCSSLRLDSVVKHLTNKPRETSAEMIRAGNIKVNWQREDSISAVVNEGDMISVSKFGRYKISKCLGTTKSGNIKIEIKHYI